MSQHASGTDFFFCLKINCEDDHGVLKGNWSNNFKEGVHPSTWSGSADILKKWAQSNYSPVKYGQCWVFAAVMCTGDFKRRAILGDTIRYVLTWSLMSHVFHSAMSLRSVCFLQS